MEEMGHRIPSTEALITKRADRRHLFQKEVIKEEGNHTHLPEGSRRACIRSGFHLLMLNLR
jgi:hypothetical protein